MFCDVDDWINKKLCNNMLSPKSRLKVALRRKPRLVIVFVSSRERQRLLIFHSISIHSAWISGEKRKEIPSKPSTLISCQIVVRVDQRINNQLSFLIKTLILIVSSRSSWVAIRLKSVCVSSMELEAWNSWRNFDCRLRQETWFFTRWNHNCYLVSAKVMTSCS